MKKYKHHVLSVLIGAFVVFATNFTLVIGFDNPIAMFLITRAFAFLILGYIFPKIIPFESFSDSKKRSVLYCLFAFLMVSFLTSIAAKQTVPYMLPMPDLVALLFFYFGYRLHQQANKKNGIIIAIAAGMLVFMNTYLLPIGRFEGMTDPILVPQFPAFTLLNTERKKINQEYMQNKVILSEVWFEGCSPCMKLLKSLEKLGERNQLKDFEIIAINCGSDTFEDFQEFVRRKNYKHITFMYDSASVLTKKLNLKTFPEEFLIDKKGNVVAQMGGFCHDCEAAYLDSMSIKIQKLVRQ